MVLCCCCQNSAKQEWRDHITAINLSTLDDNSLEIEVRNNGTVRHHTFTCTPIVSKAAFGGPRLR